MHESRASACLHSDANTTCCAAEDHFGWCRCTSTHVHTCSAAVPPHGSPVVCNLRAILQKFEYNGRTPLRGLRLSHSRGAQQECQSCATRWRSLGQRLRDAFGSTAQHVCDSIPGCVQRTAHAANCSHAASASLLRTDVCVSWCAHGRCARPQCQCAAAHHVKCGPQGVSAWAPLDRQE